MGGWFEDKDGQITRVGYNTVVDLAASKKILEQKDIPVLIVNSDLCKQFYINRTEYNAIEDRSNQSDAPQIVKAIGADMKVWMEVKNTTGEEDMIHIADPLAVYLAYHPEEIDQAIPVELAVGAYKKGVDMFSPECKNYITVKKVETSNIIVVKSLKNPAKVRDEIASRIMNLLGVKRDSPPSPKVAPQSPQPAPGTSKAPVVRTNSKLDGLIGQFDKPEPPKVPQFLKKTPADGSSKLVWAFRILFVVAFVFYEWKVAEKIRR